MNQKLPYVHDTQLDVSPFGHCHGKSKALKECQPSGGKASAGFGVLNALNSTVDDEGAYRRDFPKDAQCEGEGRMLQWVDGREVARKTPAWYHQRPVKWGL
jgi:hypothetical protein